MADNTIIKTSYYLRENELRAMKDILQLDKDLASCDFTLEVINQLLLALSTEMDVKELSYDVNKMISDIDIID